MSDAPVSDPNLKPLDVVLPEFGIEETKRLLKFIIELGKSIDKTFSKGHIGLFDAVNFYGALIACIPAFNGISQLKPELAHLDDSEIADLRAYIQSELSLQDQALTIAINDGLALAQKLYDFVLSLKSK